MTLPNIDDLNTDELRALISRASTRLEEHERIHGIPEQVGALARDYRDGGGDPAVLVDTITQATRLEE